MKHWFKSRGYEMPTAMDCLMAIACIAIFVMLSLMAAKLEAVGNTF